MKQTGTVQVWLEDDYQDISVAGWEYIWVYYQKNMDEAVEDTEQYGELVPRAAFVEKIYETGDFTELGIG